MRKWIIVVSVLLMLALVWVFSTRDTNDAPAHIAVTAPNEQALAAPSEVLDAPGTSTVRELAQVEAATSAAAAPDVTAAAAVDVAEIRGRFLLPDGTAAAGVAVKLNGAAGNQERKLRFGVPADWKDVEVATGNDGCFSIRFDPPRAFQFFMKSSLANYCESNWRWTEIEPKKLVDIGDVTLVRGGSIRGRIVDAKGRALTEGWTVYAEAGKRDFAGGKDQVRVIGKPDAGSGEYLLTGIPPGSVHLTANSRIANWIEGPDVEVRANEETRADIQYTGPDLGTRITVIPMTRPFHVFEFGDWEFVLHAPGVAERKAQRLPGSSQTFVFDELTPGSYHVELRDQRFEPWRKDGVQAGTSLDVKLKGNAALLVAVVDDVTSEPVSRYALDIRYELPNRSPTSFRILEEQAEPPADGIFAGIVPDAAVAVVCAEGYSSCEVPLTGLAPNERRAITARLVRATRLTGRVISELDRSPVERVKVELIPFKPQPESGIRTIANMHPDAKDTQSDASGRFSFENLSVGEFTVRASVNKLLNVEQRVMLTKSSPPAEIELLLPGRSWLTGKLIAPPGTDLTGLKIFAAPAQMKNLHVLLFRDQDVTSPLAADGSFSVGPVPAGIVKVSVLLPEIKRATSRSSSTSLGGQAIELGEVDLPANVETRRDFELGAYCPGTFTFQVTADARAAAEHVVTIEKASPFQIAGFVTLDSAGQGRSGPVLPGTYTFYVSPLAGNASYPMDQRIALGPNEAVNVVLELQLYSGTLRALDAEDGAPLEQQQITFKLDVPDWRGFVALQTDQEGRAIGKLPAGRYRVTAGRTPSSEEGSDIVTVDWSASGVSPAEIRLKRPARN